MFLYALSIKRRRIQREIFIAKTAQLRSQNTDIEYRKCHTVIPLAMAQRHTLKAISYSKKIYDCPRFYATAVSSFTKLTVNRII